MMTEADIQRIYADEVAHTSTTHMPCMHLPADTLTAEEIEALAEFYQPATQE
jgi:hypothetical protein